VSFCTLEHIFQININKRMCHGADLPIYNNVAGI